MGAALGVVGLPAVWLASLAGRPEVLATNAFRVGGALLAAAVAWLVYRRHGRKPPATRYLVVGVVGSLAVTALSVPVPALGWYSASGWLVSGIVGGGAVALARYAASPSFARPADDRTGGSAHRTSRRGPPSP